MPYIDWSKYQGWVTVFIGGISPVEFKISTEHDRGRHILDIQQMSEYVAGNDCHIVWEKV